MFLHVIVNIHVSSVHQLTYGQRCKDGAGLNDGEGMERLWAYLRKFAPASKHMSLANREDLLTDALLAYSRRSFSQLGMHKFTVICFHKVSGYAWATMFPQSQDLFPIQPELYNSLTSAKIISFVVASSGFTKHPICANIIFDKSRHRVSNHIQF